jgi:hypothetical protein
VTAGGRTSALRTALAATLGAFAGAADESGASPAKFDHELHETMFASCTVCHAGAERPDAPLYPPATACATCHDGTTASPIEWTPPPLSRGNLRFDHAEHVTRAGEDDTVLACDDCHAGDPAGERKALAEGCFNCHGTGEHLDIENQCASCHVPMSGAASLTAEQVARFPRPAWHDEGDFAGSGHGSLCPGDPGTDTGSASRCAVCHARDFCEVCHIDASGQPAIQQLATDERSLAHRAVLEAPADHSGTSFLHGHGLAMEDAGSRCATCHTRESCTVCHVATPRVAEALLPSSPGRARGAVVTRRAPASHDASFRAAHGPVAASDPTACAACHSRDQCLECHLPDAAAGTPGYHPPDFLARHPAAAYTQETSCSDCHNPGSFCASCHESAGISSSRVPLGSGYHDGKEFFLVGHGPAARRSLETCVSCHTERDCLVCHSATSGRRFNPHGPGFDAERLRERAPQVCTVCHGAAIPGN